MAWRPHGRARVNPTGPKALAACDRCGFLYNHASLSPQYEWRGPVLKWVGILVCTVTCLDKPFQFWRPVILGPDPLPIMNARPENLAVEQNQTGLLPPPPGYTTSMLADDT